MVEVQNGVSQLNTSWEATFQDTLRSKPGQPLLLICLNREGIYGTCMTTGMYLFPPGFCAMYTTRL